MLVDEKEREYIFNNLSEPVKDAHTQVNVVNITKLASRIRNQRKEAGASMVINVKTILFKKGREWNKGITHVKDPEHNCIYGDVVGLDSYKNILWSRIEMSEEMTFNLEHIEDAKRWAIIRMHAAVKGSPFESDPIFEVNDPTLEAEKTQKRVDIVQRLFTMIEKMKGTEIVETMRYLGLRVDKSITLKVAKSSLLDISMTSPVEVYNKLTMKTRSTEAKVRTAIELTILKDHPQRGIMYNEVVLGININDAVTKLMNDKELYESVLIQVENNDVIAKNIDDELLLSKTKDKTEKIEL